MAVCMVPMGCGSSDEHAASPDQQRQATLPASTVDALAACAKEGAGRLQRNAYAIRFEVELDDDGGVRNVRLAGKGLEDARLEGCMIDALRAIPSEFLPADVLSPQISRGDPIPGRGVLGSVPILPQWIDLAPVLITASGVTIVVTVAIIVVVAAVSVATDKPTEEDCKKQREHAYEECDKWLNSNDPPLGVVGRKKIWKECIEGYIHEDCGGTEVDREKSPGISRPGRRF